MFTDSTELEIVLTYDLPELNSIETLQNLFDDRYAVALDGDVIYANDDEPHPTASTAKMILGLAVMKAKPFALGEPGETITINQESYDLYVHYYYNGGSVSAVAVGEEISEYDALASVLLPSSNNMADTLAIWAFGSIDAYRDYATTMLNEMGINNTTIGTDASGFSETTTSTVSDLAKIGTAVLKDPVLAQIVGLSEHNVPVAGTIKNTNLLLGENNIIGVKTGFIGDVSGYCLVSGYKIGDYIVTIALTGANTRGDSFSETLSLVQKAQNLLYETTLVAKDTVVGYYDSWWGRMPIVADETVAGVGWADAKTSTNLVMNEADGKLNIQIGSQKYQAKVVAEDFVEAPNLWQKFLHVFGWENHSAATEKLNEANNREEKNHDNEFENHSLEPITKAESNNCTIKFGKLMLINPNYTVETSFIAERKTELVSLWSSYGIEEYHSWNGDNLLDAEAAAHLATMVADYEEAYPGHEMGTMSCFRSVGTNCGRLCAATGASDHHTGLTCDLIDIAYGSSLDSDHYVNHIEWQWLYENSYKYGFIDRFPEAWAGGSMSEPLNVDANGSTGLFETWHYRYVGIKAATEIATGKYNNGEYDSLEHYLKMRGLLDDLVQGTCKWQDLHAKHPSRLFEIFVPTKMGLILLRKMKAHCGHSKKKMQAFSSYSCPCGLGDRTCMRSIQVRFLRLLHKNGLGDRTWTCDLDFPKVARYQLCYTQTVPLLYHIFSRIGKNGNL